MSTTPQNMDNQEIDLSQISKKIGGFFEGISTKIFKAILFFKRYKTLVAILFVLGVALGFYLDKTSKTYNNQIIVMPNFGSVDYLYTKIDLIESKINNGDTVFLREVIGIKNPKKLKSIEIEPITDVYQFVQNKPENFEMIKLMSEDGDIKKILTENTTSKNFPYHKILFVTSEKTNEESYVQPLLKFLNSSDYFSKIQKEYTNNVKIKMKENDSIISQINGVLNSFSNEVNSTKNDKLVYYNENSQLNDIIKTKNELIYDQAANRIQLVNVDKIVKDCSSILNIKKKDGTTGKMKIILPLFFIFLFWLISGINKYAKKEMAKIESQK